MADCGRTVYEPKYPMGEYFACAVYTEPIDPNDIGNIFIEALPDPLPDDEIKRRNYRTLDFTPAVGSVNRLVQKSQVNRFRETFRIPLPYQKKLNEDFRECLVCTYRERDKMKRKTEMEIMVQDKTEKQHLTFCPSMGPAIENGISLFGESSSGKSTSMAKVLEGYPQVIRHRNEDGDITQIVFIITTASVNSDMKAMLDSMARAVDDALCNYNTGIYLKMCQSLHTVAKKADFIKDLIERFNIGAIIIDEIQNFTVNRNALDSFKSMVKLTNETKTTLVSIGTEESFSRLFDRSYLKRRAGCIINASDFCETLPETCRKNAEWIMNNQWFDEPVPITDEMIGFMCEVTCNVIGIMMRLWATINMVYIEAPEGKKPEPGLEFFRKVTYEHEADLLKMVHESRRDNLMMHRDFNLEGWPLLDFVKGTEKKAIPDAVSELDELRRYSPQNLMKYGFLNPDLASSVLRRVMENLMLNEIQYNFETVRDVLLKVMEKNRAVTDATALTKFTLKALKGKRSDGRGKRIRAENPTQDLDISSLASSL